ncbi:MAG: hypothetical protein Q7I92_04915 [Humidesulfovibrio sp.]|nr:hypothetical protein [Humidesulfovibrio sp.]
MMDESIEIIRREFALGTTTVNYNVAADGDALRWVVSMTGKTGKGSVSLVATVRSGNQGDVEKLVIIGKGGVLSEGKSPEEKKAIAGMADVFRSFFMTFSSDKAFVGREVSNRPPMFIPGENTSADKRSNPVLAGMTTYNGVECYVIKCHSEAKSTSKKTREEFSNVIDSFLLVDRYTMMPVVGELRVATRGESSNSANVVAIKRIRVVPQ